MNTLYKYHRCFQLLSVQPAANLSAVVHSFLAPPNFLEHFLLQKICRENYAKFGAGANHKDLILYQKRTVIIYAF
jgi:hypothetical protein